MQPDPHLDQFYDDYERIEEAFQADLDESLDPRGPDLLYEIVGGLGLAPGTGAVDLGCGSGRDAVQLAKRFGLKVLGVDPVSRHVEESRRAAAGQPELRSLLRFELGAADSIPAPDASVDLVWCKEVLMHVVALDAAFAECRRVLRPGGRMLIYQVFATPLLEPNDAARQWGLTVDPSRAYPQRIEEAFTAAGFEIAEQIELAGEGGERAQEERGEPGRRLLHAARLMRQPDRYIARYGQTAYDIMLGDCLWHVYRMIGKLSARVYLLKAPG